MNTEQNKSLFNYNTFHIDEAAAEFTIVNTLPELEELLQFASQNQKEIRIIGGGSNILLTQKTGGIVALNNIKGVEEVSETTDYKDIRFMSGENWHACVSWCVEHNLGGLENLSLIPGTIGAAPIQNIGAYGVELKDVFVELEAIRLSDGVRKIFKGGECAFGYRDSVFKRQEKGNYFILSVTLRLQKNPVFNIEYGDIKQILKDNFENVVSIETISNAVIKIRRSKLPDPEVTGNAGSFFKNPVVRAEQAAALSASYPHMPAFAVADGVKIPAAWLIEQCNWKGYSAGNYGVHSKQPLVLVNYGGATGKDILALSESIITSVQQRFNITLEREVNIW